MKVYNGVYFGDGVNNRTVPCPFDPDLVIVKRQGASAAVWRIDAMAVDSCSYFGPTADITTGIKDLVTRGFKVGTNAVVNSLNETYHFIAFKAESGDLEVGSYTGSGTDNRNIAYSASHSAGPTLMFIKEQASADPAIMRDSVGDTGDSSSVLASTPLIAVANLIQLITGGAQFQVGNDTKINESLKTYFYFAFFASNQLQAASYVGDGIAGKEISVSSFAPSFVLIRDTTTARIPTFRFKTTKGDLALPLIDGGAGSAGLVKNISRSKIVLGNNDLTNKIGDTYVWVAFQSTGWGDQDKYHISIDGIGHIIQSNKEGRLLYEKKPAPEFVNKFGSGDISYRDSSFWQFWAQVNWRNGAKQLRFDDAGKFWKSENIDITQLEKLKLAKRMVSAGQVKAGTKVLALSSFRASQSWWNNNYTYRKRLTITAPAGSQLPVGFPIRCTEDTAALVTAGKLRSDRKDWRVVYWNGTSWVEIKRDYVAAAVTVFALQAEIPAGSSDQNYYLHYGYAAESTTTQPSTDSEWNEVYGMFGGAAGQSIDANTLGIWHAREGSGLTLTDHDAAWDLVTTGSPTWGTNGPFGRSVVPPNVQEDAAFGVAASGELDVGSFTAEFFVKNSAWAGSIAQYGKDSDSTVKFKIQVTGQNIYFEKRTSATDSQDVTSAGNILLNDGVWHHYAVTFDGTNVVKFYRDNVLIDTKTTGGTNGIRSVNGRLHFFRSQNVADVAHIRFSNSARTSFPYGIAPAGVSVSQAAEESAQPPASSFSLFAGLSDGTIHLWDGNITWTEQFDARRLEWMDAGDDADTAVGNVSATEEKRAQSFKVDAAVNLKAISIYIRRGTAVQGITCRIETDTAGLPSGNLVHADLTATVANANIPTANGWVTFTFPTSQALAATTSYWIILQSTSFGSETGAAQVRVDSSAPSYSDGNLATKSGAGAWAADTAKDMMFRALGNTTQINCSFVSKVGGTLKILWGIGDITSEINGDARIYSYDGTTWKLERIFAAAQVLSISESKIGATTNLFAGTGGKGEIYKTSDLTTWPLSFDIEKPQNPGYPYSLFEYNRFLYAGGGSPELLDDKKYNGFFYQFNQVDWDSVFPFDHTVVKSMQFYDAFLFLGSYHGQLFVFNTVSLDPLFSFSDDYNYKVQIQAQFFFDDKLWFGLIPQDGITPVNEGVWVFDRHGMHQVSKISGVNGYYSFAQANNEFFVGTGDDGYVYKQSSNQYAASGNLQTSYFDATLPSINKLYNEFLLQFDPLPSGTSITVSYKFKESDSWTQLGVANIANSTSATLVFPTGTLSKKISFLTRLDTNDPAVTPEINEYVLKYSVYTARKWQWNIRVLAKDFVTLLDRSQDPRTGIQVMDDIARAQQAEKLNTFVDIDGKSYSVYFYTLDSDSWVARQFKGGAQDPTLPGLEDTIAVTLLEA